MEIERFKLHHGPFTSPRARVGDTVTCVIHGEKQVLGFSDGRIPWPLVRPSHGGRPVPALLGGLIEAVRHESKQAIVYWWGVSEKTVWNWRRALGVPEHNEGTIELRRGYAAEKLHTEDAQARAAAAARDPRRRARTSALLTGRRRPAEVVAKLRKALAGRVISPRWRKRIARQKRLAASQYRSGGRPWSPQDDALILKLPPAAAARRLGRSPRAIADRRRLLQRNLTAPIV